MLRSAKSSIVCVLGGLSCLAAGALAGSWWATQRAAEALWHDAHCPHTTPAPAATWPSFRDLVEKVSPAVATVQAHLAQSAEAQALAAGALAPGRMSSGLVASGPSADSGATPVFAPLPGRRRGSGFVVHEKGLVLTSRHVVLGALSVEVLLPQHGRLAAELVGEDAATDLALLRLVDPPEGLPCLELGNSEDLRAGDWIVTVGDPYGFSRTVTAGLVSFVGRHLQHSDFGVTSDYLQISAPINPGNSGCPVLDVDGRVVGLTTQVAADAQGISFAVPSRSVKWALEAMQRRPDGRVRRGYLGIEFATRSASDDTGQAQGVVIVNVAAGEPADRAGLRQGDVVLRVDGDLVRDAKDLHERIVRSDPGSTLALELLRDGVVSDPVVAVLGEVGGATKGLAN